MGNRNKGLRDYQKVSLLLLLFKNLRDRTFHFENLYKLNNDNKPRLSTSIQNNNKQKMIINLATENIEIFLDDILMGLVEKSLERIGEKDPLETKRIIAELNQGIK